jgi:Acyl-CoA thioester hydrolase/BAAT N-terminal region
VPVTGDSYLGAADMGLFQTMTPTTTTKDGFFLEPENGHQVTLTVTVGGRTVASTVVRRETAAALGVTEHLSSRSSRSTDRC